MYLRSALLCAATFSAAPAAAFVVPRSHSLASSTATAKTSSSALSMVAGLDDKSKTASSSSSSIKTDVDKTWAVEKLDKDDAIMDVASYRNNRTSPQGVIDKQMAKRAAQDNTGAAVRGGITGLLIGATYGILTYTSANGSIQEAVNNFVFLGGIMAALLAGNSLSGRNVYVSTMDDASNRLKVDYVEGLMARQDVGFAARLTDNVEGAYGGRFAQTNGIVAAIDCQLRNCEASQNVKTFGSLPPHVHIRNLAVDQKCRRMGIAQELVKAVEEYAKNDTEAEVITLVVDDTNAAAIGLYKSLGYDMESIGNPTTAMPKYGQWTNGRSMMTKIL